MLLNIGDRQRLEEHLEAAEAKKLLFVCVNVKQNKSFWAMDNFMPALTTESALAWGKDMSSTGRLDRQMLAYELLGAHGYPVLLPRDDPLSKLLPRCFTFRHAFESERALAETEITRLVGNGMHMVQIAFALCHGLFCVSSVKVASDRGSPVAAAAAVVEPRPRQNLQKPQQTLQTGRPARPKHGLRFRPAAAKFAKLRRTSQTSKPAASQRVIIHRKPAASQERARKQIRRC